MAIKQTWTADFGQAQAEMAKMQGTITKLQDKLRAVSQEGKKGASSHQQLMRAARRAYQESRPGQQKYIDKLRELDAQLKKGIITQEQFRQQAARAHAAMLSQSGQAQRGVASWAASLKGVVAGYFSVRTAIQLVVQAMQEEEELRRKAKEAHVSLAEAERGAIRMLSIETPVEEYQAAVQKLFEEIKPAGGKVAVHQVMQDTLSAAGDLRRAAEAARLGLAFAPYDLETARGLAGGALDISKAIGEKDLMKAMGWLISATGQARVTTPEEMAKYATPAVAGMTATEMTPEEAVSLYNALTKSLGDKFGRLSKTAAISIAKDIADFFPEEDVYERIEDPLTGRVRKKLKRRGFGEMSFEQRWQRLREDEELREQFIAKYVASAPATSYGGYMAMLGAHPSEAVNADFLETFKQSMAAMPKVEAAGERTQQMLDRLGATVSQKIAGAEHGKSGTFERLETETELGQRLAMEAQYAWFGEKGLSQLLAQSGDTGLMGQFTRWSEFFDYYLRIDRTRQEAFEEILGRKIKELRGISEITGGGLVLPTHQPTADELLRADILENELEKLRKKSQGILTPEIPPAAPVSPAAPTAARVPSAKEFDDKLDRLIDSIDRQTTTVEQGNAATEALAEEIRGQREIPRPRPQVIDAGAEPALSW